MDCLLRKLNGNGSRPKKRLPKLAVHYFEESIAKRVCSGAGGSPWTLNLHTTRPSALRPLQDAIPIGIGWSGDSWTPMESGSWR
jgi:hypothetical protein